MGTLRSLLLIIASCVLAGTPLIGSVSAQNREVPYWATLRFDEVNMRVGPSQEYKIDWVYKRKGLPVKVVRVRESWRLVEDHEGTRGWIAASQLNPKLGAIVIGEGLVELREAPEINSAIKWRAEPGIVAEFFTCRGDFCEIDVAGRGGWVRKERLWGAGPLEPQNN